MAGSSSTWDLIAKSGGTTQPLPMPKKAANPLMASMGLGTNPILDAQPIEAMGSQPMVYVPQALPSRLMTPKEFKQATDLAMSSPLVQDQIQGINNTQKLLAMGAPEDADLITPLAGLLQAEFGRDTSGFTKPGAGERARQEQLSGMLKIQDDKAALAKTLLATIGTQKQTGGMGAKAPNAESMKPKLFTEFQKYTKDDQAALSDSQNALNTIMSGSLTGQEAFKNFMARASGEKGPLTETDISRFSGDPSVQGRLARVYEKGLEGKLTAADKADMVLLASKYAEFRQNKLAKSSDYFINQVAPGAYMTQPETARSLLIPQGGFGLQGEQLGIKPKVAKPNKPIDQMTDEELTAYEKALGI